MIDQALFDGAFFGVLLHGQEFEVVGIFQKLPGKVGLRGGKGAPEVGRGFPLALIEFTLDLDDQDVPSPSVFDGGAGVPKALIRVFYLVQQNAIVKSRNLSSSLLDNCFIGPGVGKSAHIHEVSA